MSRDFEKCEYCGMVTHEIEATDSGFQVCIETDGRGEYVSHQECCKRICELEAELKASRELMTQRTAVANEREERIRELEAALQDIDEGAEEE